MIPKIINQPGEENIFTRQRQIDGMQWHIDQATANPLRQNEIRSYTVARDIFANWKLQEELLAKLKIDIQQLINKAIKSGVTYQDEIIALLEEITKELKEGK